MDKVSKEKRSETMRAVKSAETSLERNFRKRLWSRGIRYRKNAPGYFGKPDLVLKRVKTAIFLDSCFWHGCPWHCRMPQSDRLYWEAKKSRNKRRDREVTAHYRSLGWRVIRIWEHQLRKNFGGVLDRIETQLRETQSDPRALSPRGLASVLAGLPHPPSA